LFVSLTKEEKKWEFAKEYEKHFLQQSKYVKNIWKSKTMGLIQKTCIKDIIK
jgi:hypothetical protein